MTKRTRFDGSLPSTHTPISRRGFLAGALAGGALLLTPPLEAARRRRLLLETDDCGVASGDPRHDSIVLWTRVPSTFQPSSGSLDVTWELSTSETFEAGTIVKSGVITTSADRDFTVKVKVTGLLPFTRYHYQFKAGGYQSVSGRTLTAPHPDAEVDRIRFAFTSCQSYPDGYYNVLQVLAQDDVDFCLALGDYTYEGGGDQVRPDTISAVSLSTYREKYRLYLTDPNLREVRRLFPWICIWDDHEVYNDYAGGDLSDEDRERQRAAYQAYREFMPIDPGLPYTEEGGVANLQLYRKFTFGTLLEVFALDERQYRDGQVCPLLYASYGCEALYDPARTMLGEEQREWLKGGLADSRAQWKVLMNEVMMMAFKLTNEAAELFRHRLQLRETYEGRLINLDQWDGYPAERADLLQFIKDEQISNVVVLTGDIHNCYAGVLRPDFTDASTPAVAVEIVGGSVTSDGIAEYVGGADLTRLISRALEPANPHLQYLDAKHHVYTRVEVTPEATVATYVAVNTIRLTAYEPFTLKTFTIPDGSPELIAGE